MSSKVIDLETAEALISGTATLSCVKCSASSWVKANPNRQTKKLGYLTVLCKTCRNTASLVYLNNKYATDEAFREARKATCLANQNQLYATDEAFREAKKAYQKERRVTDEEWSKALKARSLAWARENPGKASAHSAKRRAKKLQATPPWSDLAAIQEIYELCPEGHHVDHIVPLQGRKVSGLHVPSNLQYLTAVENSSKGNKFSIN